MEVAQKLASDFVDSWNHHDMARFAELFHSDASFVNVIGLVMNGKDEIESIHAAAHAGPFLTSTLQMRVEDARTVVPRVMVAHMRSSLLGDSRDPSNERKTLFTFVLELREDRWRIVAAHNTNIPSTSS
jgi:uncharacterized protein (TIGR02246 family)